MSNITVGQTTSNLKELIQSGLMQWKDSFLINNTINEDKAKALIAELWQPNDVASKSIGDRLEEVAKYFLDNTSIVGDLRHGKKNKQHQIDHFGEISIPVFEYLKTKDIKVSGFLGESKNYKDAKISVDFVYKVEALKLFTKAGLGCYFARKTLTGDELSAGQALLKDFYQKYNTVSIIFTDEDWKFLEKSPKKYPDLVYHKLSNYFSNYECSIEDYSQI